MLENKNEEYQSNAYNKSKLSLTKEREEPKPIAKGKEKKPSLRERLTDSFLAVNGDDIKERVIFDWVIPGIKNILEDVVHMLLFGDKADPRISRSRGESRFGGVDYRKISEDRRRKDEYIPRSRKRDPEIVFTTRKEAEEVLVKLYENVDKYGNVTAKDLYLYADMQPEFPMSNWGWRNLTGSSVVEVRGGYLLKLPKMEELR